VLLFSFLSLLIPPLLSPGLDRDDRSIEGSPLGVATSQKHSDEPAVDAAQYGDVCTLLLDHGATLEPSLLLFRLKDGRYDDAIRTALLARKNHVDVEAVTTNPKTNQTVPLLVDAVNMGDQVLVNELLHRGANPLSVATGGFTSLHVASQLGHVDIVASLLSCCDKGKEVIARRTDANEWQAADGNLTPLHLAAEHPDVVRTLLGHVGSNTAAARECCDATLVTENMHLTKILSEDTHVNLGWPETVVTQLHLCAMGGTVTDVGTARLLLQHGADVHRQLKIPSEHQTSKHQAEGLTPLHLACFFNRVEMVELLMEHGARHDHPGWVEATNGKIVCAVPSLLAWVNGAEDVIQLLQRAGVEVAEGIMSALPAPWVHPETGEMRDMKVPTTRFFNPDEGDIKIP
jgi:ankyrin repeat protein